MTNRGKKVDCGGTIEFGEWIKMVVAERSCGSFGHKTNKFSSDK